ncbi:MAG: energy transducer TonB [Candidatus Aminicenantales bacterium]
MNQSILKNKPGLLKHIFSFLASLVIHAVILYFMAAHFVSVKILDFKEQVTDIVIAPRSKLEAPRIEGPLPEVPQNETDLLFGIPTRRRPTAPAEPVDMGREALSGLPGEASSQQPQEPRFTEGFRLDSRTEASNLARPDRLRLTIPERQSPGSGITPIFRPSAKATDLRRYVHSGFSGVSGFAAGGGAKRPRSTPSQVRIIPRGFLKVDLSPWARTAVELIQKNWNAPAPLASASGLAVEVAIVVLKNGEISTIEILTPSDDSEFNQAAREALEVSSPLPALPASFPAASLEVTLIFARQ